MPESYPDTSKKNKPGLTEQELKVIDNLLGRKPNEFELDIITYFIKKNSDDDNSHEKTAKYQITDEHNCIVKTEWAIIEPSLAPEIESSKVIFKLFSSILENHAQPVALVNLLKLDKTNSKKAKPLLDKIIKGTGKVSNVTGIPNLKTNVDFNNNSNGFQYIYSASIGLINNSAAAGASEKGNIYILGKLQNTDTSGKLKPLSAFYFKYLKDAINEILNSNSSIGIENIRDGGILNSITKLIQKLTKGAELDISTLSEKNDKENIRYLFEEQPTALLVFSEKEGKLLEVARKWEVDCIKIGKISSKNKLIVIQKKEKIVDLPLLEILDKFADLEIKSVITAKTDNYKSLNISKIKLPKKLRDVAWFLIKHPNIASNSCINQQYDSMVGGLSMNTNFPSDAEVINLKGTSKALVLCISKNDDLVTNFPELGTQLAIAELGRKMVCSGAKPLGVTSNILLSNTKTNHSEKISKINSGVEKIAQKFKISADSYKSYFTPQAYNISPETEASNTSFAMLGLIEDKNHQMTMSFKDKGNIIFLIGASNENLVNSEYLISYHQDKTGYIPEFELNTERKIQLVVLELIAKNAICSAHNVGKGGLFISLVESAMVFGFGFDIITDTDIRTDAFLFGESPGRVIVSVTPNKEDKFIDFMMQKELPFLAIGHVTKGEMRVDDISYGFIDDAKEEYNNALKKFLDEDF